MNNERLYRALKIFNRVLKKESETDSTIQEYLHMIYYGLYKDKDKDLDTYTRYMCKLNTYLTDKMKEDPLDKEDISLTFKTYATFDILPNHFKLKYTDENCDMEDDWVFEYTDSNIPIIIAINVNCRYIVSYLYNDESSLKKFISDYNISDTTLLTELDSSVFYDLLGNNDEEVIYKCPSCKECIPESIVNESHDFFCWNCGVVIEASPDSLDDDNFKYELISNDKEEDNNE